MRTPARVLSVFILTALSVLIASQAASAKVESVKPSRVTSTVAVFDVTAQRSADVRSAAIQLGSRKNAISAATVKRAAKRGTLRVRLPRTWRGAVASAVKRSRGGFTPKLILKTLPGKTVHVTPPPAPVKTGQEPPRPSPTTPATAPASGPAPTPTPAPDPAPAPPVSISGRTFYVSATGSDVNAGTSPQAAWRTVTRVNRASLTPGDGVLFQGGATFSDDSLMPESSGTSGAPLVFGSYGTGRATLTEGSWFMGKSWLAFTDLAFTGLVQGVNGSTNGTGSHDILVQNSTFTGMTIAVNAANHSDRNWTLRNNTIDGTRDSGVILNGEDHTVDSNTILNTGTDRSISYGKHGIYLKAANSRVTGNTIRNFEANGVSARYRNSVIEDNTISGGQIGIGWFQYDTTPGTSFWRNNAISDTSAACLYVSQADDAGATRESFVVSNNRLARSAGRYTDFQATSGSYSLLSNIQL